MMHDDRIKLLIIGTPAYQGVKDDSFVRNIKKLAQKMSNEVIFTGYIPQSQLPVYYSMTSVFVLPSICNEAAGNVIIEAMSCGLPVVSTTQGGIPEYADKKASLLVAADANIEMSLHDALSKLINNPDIKRSLSINARNVALQYDKYHYYTNFKALIDHYLKEYNKR